ncbi:MAG TPA: GNAT family protein [Candidatus Baltobacteraceae bacterium]|jgi:aminoglycoside 6'-N-acetyltransferase|nr:GNAT family protein [Candidatus Baltobacteraceae bacterium]
MHQRVRLRPLIESDLDLADTSGSSERDAGEFQWFGFTTAHAARRRFAENGSIGPDGGTFAVTFDDEPVGTVDWFKAFWGRAETSWCWTLGIGIVTDMRGRGIGTQAQRLVADYLFRHTRAERVQAFTDAENAAERRALEKAGFTQEGVIRRGQWRGGSWHDQVLYSLLRSEWRSP